ncbi:MAG: nucleotidyltransferase [bacterium]
MNFDKLLAKITALFKTTKTPYMLVGGFAVAYWGYPRQSLDIDLVADLNKGGLKDFLTAAKKHGFFYNEKEIATILKVGNRFAMELDDFRIDCWLPKTSYDRTALENRKQKNIFGQKLSIISPEDLIIAKLKIGRARDYEDIKTVLARQGKKLKKAYLNRQALSHNVSAELERLIKEV